MNLITVTVSGQINQPGGAPAAYASVRFALSAPGVDGLALVVPRYADAVCDVQGAFAAQVVPSPAGTYYDVRIGLDDVLLVRVRVVVPASDCQFAQIMQTLPHPSIDAAQRALLDLQAAQALFKIDQQGIEASAADALRSQDAARVSAAAAADGAVQANLAKSNAAEQVVLAAAQAADALTRKTAAAASAAEADAKSATAAANAVAAGGAAAAANTALLALGNVLANGIGALQTDVNGELIVSYNSPTVTSMAIDAAGNLTVTYP